MSAVAASQPKTSIHGANGAGMVLHCVSGGWYPEPELEWRDSEGRLLPADVTKTDRHPDHGPHQRYTVRSNMTVQKTEANRFTCRVQLQRLNHIRETEIHVPGEVLCYCYWLWNSELLFCILSLFSRIVTVLFTVCFRWHVSS